MFSCLIEPENDGNLLAGAKARTIVAKTVRPMCQSKMRDSLSKGFGIFALRYPILGYSCIWDGAACTGAIALEVLYLSLY